MKNLLSAGLAGLIAALGLGGAAQAEAWSRAFVVEWIEPAAYFAGTGAPTEPGADCPKGTEPELNLRQVLQTSYRSAEDVEKAIDPEQRSKGEGLFQAMTIRGLNKENIYKNPKASPDPGMREMEGSVAEGFNLDGDDRTGFVGPHGEKGIDNRFYKAWGCWEAFRGPIRKSGAIYHNDEMRNGKFTVVILISGNKDPLNDPDTRLAFYTSKDKIVKDANGDVAPFYSFRIADDPAHTTVLEAKITNGVIELSRPQEIRTREASFLASLTLFQGRARLTFKPDGGLEGMLGGYKPIEEAIATWTIAGPNVELVTHVNLSAAYYAIERNADARPDPATGKNTAISTAVRFFATPAFVIRPDGSGLAQVAQLYQQAKSP